MLTSTMARWRCVAILPKVNARDRCANIIMCRWRAPQPPHHHLHRFFSAQVAVSWPPFSRASLYLASQPTSVSSCRLEGSPVYNPWESLLHITILILFYLWYISILSVIDVFCFVYFSYDCARRKMLFIVVAHPARNLPPPASTTRSTILCWLITYY